MSKHKIFKVAKVKVLVFLVLFCEFTLLSPFRSTVSAHEINDYLNPNFAVTNNKINNLSLNNGIVNKPQPLTPAEIEALRIKAEEAEREAKENAWAQTINNFLASKNSPMTGYGKTLVEMNKKYGVDPKLIIAISGVESSFCQINFRPYNCWGWFTKTAFSSYENALDLYSNYLSSYYFARGYNTVEKIGPIYCPPTYNSWISKVYRFMGQMNF